MKADHLKNTCSKCGHYLSDHAHCCSICGEILPSGGKVLVLCIILFLMGTFATVGFLISR